MNPSDFRALLAEYMTKYALENPNRPLSTVTVRDFDAWLERRSYPTRYAALRRDLNFGFPGSLCTTPADETDAQIRERIARERPAPDTHGLSNGAEGSPRCDLCKDTGWRPSVERGRKVPCECGARPLASARTSAEMSRMFYKVEGEPIRNGDTLMCVGVEIKPNGDAVATLRRVVKRCGAVWRPGILGAGRTYPCSLEAGHEGEHKALARGHGPR